MDRHAEARPFRDKVVELAPDTMSYYSRADLLYEMGEYAAAIPDFTRSTELDHEQVLGAANFLYRADCHRRLGNFAEAVADCARVPDNFDFPEFLGHRNGSKHHLLAEIARERNLPRSS
jgi:tetratricopeptide (TPR) repeat protein